MISRNISNARCDNHRAWCEISDLEADLNHAGIMLSLIHHAQREMFDASLSDNADTAVDALREPALMFVSRAHGRLPAILSHTSATKRNSSSEVA